MQNEEQVLAGVLDEKLKEVTGPFIGRETTPEVIHEMKTAICKALADFSGEPQFDFNIQVDAGEDGEAEIHPGNIFTAIAMFEGVFMPEAKGLRNYITHKAAYSQVRTDTGLAVIVHEISAEDLEKHKSRIDELHQIRKANLLITKTGE